MYIYICTCIGNTHKPFYFINLTHSPYLERTRFNKSNTVVRVQENHKLAERVNL